MIRVETLEFPDEQKRAFARARRLEWISIAYIASAAAFLYLVMGSSQAMRTSWLEDMVSLLPPVAFLVSARLATRPASRTFPYGMHSAVSVGYLAASLALIVMGGYLLIEALLTMLHGERTTIGGLQLFGTTVWAGWPMLAALAYTGIPSFFLGRAKLKLAPIIHNKVLFADAEMNRADWMAETAAAAGVVGAGFGLWWADPLAAGIVSLDILRDGARNLRAAVTDLIDESPKETNDPDKLDPLPARLARHIESLDWVEKAEVRMREEGHVYFGEAYVMPGATAALVERIGELRESAKRFHWRIHDLTIMPVDRRMLDGDGPKEPP